MHYWSSTMAHRTPPLPNPTRVMNNLQGKGKGYRGRKGGSKRKSERKKKTEKMRERGCQSKSLPPSPFALFELNTVYHVCMCMCVCVIIFTHSKDYTRSFLKTWHIINSVTAMAIGLSETTPPLAQISIVLYCETI